MSSIHFIKTELAAAFARGVRQCVVVGSRSLLEGFKSSPNQSFHLFTVDEEQSSVSPSGDATRAGKRQRDTNCQVGLDHLMS